MRKRWLIGLVGATVALTGAMFALAGCGGGGGPVTPPTTTTPGISQQFLQMLPQNATGESATYVGTDKCLSCHGTGANGAPKVDVARWQKTKHAQVSVGCEQCHGPGSKHVLKPGDDTILTYENPVVEDLIKSGKATTNQLIQDKDGKTRPLTITRSFVCGQCHGPMFSDQQNSLHAQEVTDVMEEVIANPAQFGKSSGCIRCHSARFRTEHIEQVLSDTGGELNGNIGDRDAVEAEINGLALTDFSAEAEQTGETASCSVCHDPMYYTDNLTWDTKKVAQLRRREPDTVTQADIDREVSEAGPGSPTKIHTTIEQTCGTCHNGRGGKSDDATLNASTGRPTFHEGPQLNMLIGITGAETITGADNSPQHVEPAQRRTAHASAPGQCVHCHMPNAHHTMTVQFDVSCQPCHSPADAAARAAIRGDIQLRLLQLATRMQTWAKAKFGNANPDSWDYTSQIPAGETVPPQAQVPLEIKRARHNYYFVLRDKSFGIHNSGYTRYLLDIANQNLDSIPNTGRAATITPTQAQVQAFIKAALQRSRQGASGL